MAYPDRHPGARPGVPLGGRHGGQTLVDPAALAGPGGQVAPAGHVALAGPAAFSGPAALSGPAAGSGLAPGGRGDLDGDPTSPSTGAARPGRSGRHPRGLVIAVAATVTALAVVAGVLLAPSLFGEREATNAGRTGTSLDLAAFPRVDVVDRFTDDTSGHYAAYRENNNEILPVTTAGEGKFAGTGSAPFFGLVAGTGRPSSGEAVSVLTTGTFAGTGQPEDSVFVGWVKGGNDYVTAWYNNTRKDTGLNVRVNGTYLETPGQSALALEPGDRFALLLSGNMVTSYAETDGVWHRLITADIGDVLATPQARQDYRYGFGLRGSTGTIGIAGTEGRSAE